MGYRIQKKKTQIDCLTHEDRNSVRIGTEPGASSSGSRHLRGSLLSSRWNRRNDGFLFGGFKIWYLQLSGKKHVGSKWFNLWISNYMLIQFLGFQWNCGFKCCLTIARSPSPLVHHHALYWNWPFGYIFGKVYISFVKIMWLQNFAGAWAPGGIGIRHRWNIENHGPGCHLRAMENPWKKPAEIYGKAWDPRL